MFMSYQVPIMAMEDFNNNLLFRFSWEIMNMKKFTNIWKIMEMVRREHDDILYWRFRQTRFSNMHKYNVFVVLGRYYRDGIVQQQF